MLSAASEDKPDVDEGEDDQAKFARLISEARDLTSKGQVKEALEMYKEAQKISPSDKLSRKMERMEVTQDFIKNCLVITEDNFKYQYRKYIFPEFLTYWFILKHVLCRNT